VSTAEGQTLSTAAPAPPLELRFRRRIRFGDAVREVWRARELVRSLVERELRAYYTRATLGFAWAIITPVTFMLVFMLFVPRFGRVDTGGTPYPLFLYLGLLPWTFFSGSVSRAGLSLIQNAPLLNRMYCPREIFPLAGMIVVAVETLIATLVLIILFLITGFAPRATTVWLPVLLLVQVVFTLGVTLLISAVVVYYRDLRHALPLLLQFGLLATPVAYGLAAVPERYRSLYVALNPLASVIDGYRRTILLGYAPERLPLLVGAASSALLLAGAYVLFKHLETGFADVA
jgi:ABC-2 type transport system permease protein/lipopolysaccharide transport system permease protein